LALFALLIQFHLNAPELNEKIACGGSPSGIFPGFSHSLLLLLLSAGVGLLATDLKVSTKVFYAASIEHAMIFNLDSD